MSEEISKQIDQISDQIDQVNKMLEESKIINSSSLDISNYPPIAMDKIFIPINPKSSDPEPFLPSKAIVAVQCGIPYILYWHGNELEYWISCVGENYAAKDIAEDEKDGVYFWSGWIGSQTDYWGEYDEWLEAKELRPITKEEWQLFIDGEIPWDWEEVQAHDVWVKKGLNEGTEA